MNSNPYRSTKETRKEATQLTAYFDGQGKLPKGTSRRLVFPPSMITKIRNRILELVHQAFRGAAKSR